MIRKKIMRFILALSIVSCLAGCRQGEVSIQTESVTDKEMVTVQSSQDTQSSQESQSTQESQSETATELHEHEWDDGEVIISATTDKEGRKRYNCIKCDETKEETVPKLKPHKWNEGEIAIESTCDKEGEIIYTCEICQETKIEKLPLSEEHKWDEGAIVKEATCIEKGEKIFTCKECKDKYTEEVNLSNAHKWDKGKIITANGCSKEGVIQHTCELCKVTKNDIIAPTNAHVYSEGVITLKPTCGSNGTKIYTCSQCSYCKTENISATGNHTWNEGMLTKEATIQSAGIITYYCKDCDTTNVKNTPKITDKSTTAYSTNKILYISGIPVYGVVKINNNYYIPTEIFSDENVLPNGFAYFYEDDNSYSLSFSNYGQEMEIHCIKSVFTVPNDKYIGTAKLSSKVLTYNKTEISNAVYTLNDNYPMVRLDLIGAVAKGNDFYLETGSNFKIIAEEDLVGKVLPSLQRAGTQETIKAIHDYIVNTLTYDPRVSCPWWATQELYNEVDSIYNKACSQYTMKNNITLASKYGVCHHYADLFRDMCNRMGIPCEDVTGMGNGESHAWNRVYIDGKWSLVDCTWDDPISQTPVCNSNYFMIDGYALANSHVWSGNDYPYLGEYDKSWDLLDINNITSKNMFRKCLISQMMQGKQKFSLRPANWNSYGGFAVMYKYDVWFWYMQVQYNQATGAYDFEFYY